MLTLNDKSLKKPYGLYRTQFLSQLFTEAFERKIIKIINYINHTRHIVCVLAIVHLYWYIPYTFK